MLALIYALVGEGPSNLRRNLFFLRRHSYDLCIVCGTLSGHCLPVPAFYKILYRPTKHRSRLALSPLILH